MPHTITFLDTETTALHARRKPWEIALIQRVTDAPGGPVDREILIQITRVDLVDAEMDALKVGRFFHRHIGHRFDSVPIWCPPPRPRPSWTMTHPDEIRDQRVDRQAELVTILDQLIDSGEMAPGTIVAVDENDAAAIVEHWTRDTNVIGLNPQFDTLTLSTMLARHDRDPEPWDYHLTNIATEAAGWLRAQAHMLLTMAEEFGTSQRDSAEETRAMLDELTQLPRKSARVSALCGVEPPSADEAHTALGDARWMRRWWDAITPEVPAHV